MISVTVLTRDSEGTLAATLESIRCFDEVIVLDSGSCDRTCEIANGFSNVLLYRSGFCGFGPQHNMAASYATHDWILSLDSDEVVSPELAKEIFTVKLDLSRIYSFPFRNYYNDKRITCCGWSPDRHVRLYNKAATQFTDAHVHERIIDEGLRRVDLQGHIDHYSYRSTADFLRKMQNYSDLFALQNKGKMKSSMCKALLHGAYAFWKSYIMQRGICSWPEGFLISLYNANTTFYKYIKLHEANKEEERHVVDHDVP